MKTKEIYKLRDSYSIVGLTGRTGSGCTQFSKIISEDINFEKHLILRRPEDIKYISDQKLNDNNTIFKRKYTICYNFFKKHNSPYKQISYLSSLIFYSIHFAVNKEEINSSDGLIDFLHNLINENFTKSTKTLDEKYIAVSIAREEVELLSNDFGQILSLFKSVKPEIKKIIDSNDFIKLHECFFGSQFESFTHNLFRLFAMKDYYLGSFFVHRLGNKIRATGNPLADSSNLRQKASPDYIYSVVYLMNKLIKAWKVKSQNGTCHICIDSLRNSLEIMFLKERYSAFYMIAIHNDERHKEIIHNRIEMASKESVGSKNPNNIDLIASKVIELDETEHDGESFKIGRFFAPDVENCIQKSDIHINNPGNTIEDFNEVIRQSTFYTMTEQWIKIKSLMLHPGLITPSHEERCMQIAFNSKLNSGCISRQVGAVITDDNNSIRSVGWNDVPKGSIPCNIRNLEDVINPNEIHNLDLSYSTFETVTNENTYKDGENFSLKTKAKYKLDIKESKAKGLNHSFCFKSLHNKFEGKDNQVHTRSLHAEENAMLQISKYGGQPLKNGTLYTTASPCELCAKKAYQLGLNIVYIDPYPGISMKHILVNGYAKPETKLFTGIIGKAYNKLFEPLLSYKDELALLSVSSPDLDIDHKTKVITLLEEIFDNKIKHEFQMDDFKQKLKNLFE